MGNLSNRKSEHNGQALRRSWPLTGIRRGFLGEADSGSSALELEKVLNEMQSGREKGRGKRRERAFREEGR